MFLSYATIRHTVDKFKNYTYVLWFETATKTRLRAKGITSIEP